MGANGNGGSRAGGNDFTRNPKGSIPQGSAPPDFTKKSDQPSLGNNPMPTPDASSVPTGGRSVLPTTPVFGQGKAPSIPFKNLKG